MAHGRRPFSGGKDPFTRNGHKPSIDKPRREGPGHRGRMIKANRRDLRIGLGIAVVAVIIALYLTHAI